MKGVRVHPNGSIVTRNPTNEKTVQIIRNLLVGGWTAVANAVFHHPVTNALHMFSNRRCSAYFYIVHQQNQYLHPCTLNNCLQYPVLFPDDCPVRSSFVSLLNKKKYPRCLTVQDCKLSCYCVKTRKFIRIKIRKLISNNIEINKYYGFSLSLY